MIDSPMLRRRVDEALLTDADLESFCLDYFPAVHRRFGGQMERRTKVNLLFELVPDRDEILRCLDRYTAVAASLPPRASARGFSDLSAGWGQSAGSGDSLNSTPQRRGSLSWRNPLAMLRAALVTVPVMKYALGVATLVVAVTIATRGFGLDLVTVAGGVFIVSGPMAVLLVMAAAARQSVRLVLPTMVLTWAVLALMVSSSLLLLGSFFFSWPKSTPCLFQPAQCDPLRSHSPRGFSEGRASADTSHSLMPTVKDSPGPRQWTVAGRVRDTHQKPLVGITVSLPLLRISTETNEQGHFQLSVQGEPGSPVLLRAEKRPVLLGGRPMYRPNETRVHLGSSELDITLEKER